MKNTLTNTTMTINSLSSNRIDWSSSKMRTINIPASSDTTTADRLIYLKECLDKKLIDQALFRALRDELTYGGGFA